VGHTPNSPADAGEQPTVPRDRNLHPTLLALLVSLILGLVVVVGVGEHHIILGLVLISVLVTLCNQLARLWIEHPHRHLGHH
jgi:hypothetical protein